jgi:hypothetical protein
VDTTELRAAYAAFLAEAAAGGFGPPPPGEWTDGEIVAHIARNDELLTATTEQILAGEPATFDNRPALESLTGGDVRTTGERLCDLVDQLSPEQAETVVPVFIQDGERIAVDRPMPWGALLQAQSGFHLPAHGEQLRSLRPLPG